MTEQYIDIRDIKLGKDLISIIGPFEKEEDSAYTHYYQNNDTRALDLKFGLDGGEIEDYDSRVNNLLKSVGPFSLGNLNVESTLNHFVQLAKREFYNFVGVREDEVKATAYSQSKLSGKLFIEESLKYKNGEHGPFLVRKRVEGHIVLFPRKLPMIVG